MSFIQEARNNRTPEINLPFLIEISTPFNYIQRFSIPIDLFAKAVETTFHCDLFYLTNQKDIGSVKTFLLNDCHHWQLYALIATLFVRVFAKEGDEFWYEMNKRIREHEITAKLEHKKWDTAPVSRKGINNSLIIATEMLKAFQDCPDEHLSSLNLYFKFLKLNMESDPHFKTNPNCDQLRSLPIFNDQLNVPQQDLKKLYTFKIYLFCSLVREQLNHLINSTQKVRQSTLNQALIEQIPTKKCFYSAGLGHFIINRNLEPTIRPTLQNKAFLIIAVNINFVYSKTWQDDVKMANERSNPPNTLPFLTVAFKAQYQQFLAQNQATLKELGL
jgi:hypothetical protein